MGLGVDLKEVYEDVGVALSKLSGGAFVSTCYGKVALNRQVTKPFIREFFQEVALPYDTAILPGDVVQQIVSEEVFLVMNKTPRIFENEIIDYGCVFYKCNVSGELVRPSAEETWDSNYKQIQGWTEVEPIVYGLLTEALYGHDLDGDKELGQIGLENHELYVSHNAGVQILDRYVAVSGEEWHKVETIKKRRYNNVDVCELAEDTR